MRATWLLLVIMVMPVQAFAEDLYVSQAGGGAGTSCGSAQSASWFNAAGNWGVGSTKISAGDTVHLCGTITTSLIAQGSGSVGSPITILFETGAKIVHPTSCPGTGCLNLESKSYLIVDGGMTCGYVASVNTACNGKIYNTTAQPVASSFGIAASGCSNCEIKNLEVGPIYKAGGGVAGSGGDYRGIQNLGGTSTGATYKVHHNVIHDVASGIVYVPSGASDNGLQVYNNFVYNINSSVDISNNNGGQMTAALIHDNHFGSTANWDGAGCPNHHNSLHAFATVANGVSNSGIDYYNNLIDGNWGACVTAGLFIEGGSDGANKNVRVWNNVWALTYTAANCLVGLWGSGAVAFYNNTIISDLSATSPALCIDYSNSVSVLNNIVRVMNGIQNVVIRNSSTMSVTIWNNNLYERAISAEAFLDRTAYQTFSDWQAAHLSFDANSNFSTSSNYVRIDATGHLLAGSPAIGMGVNLTSLGITALNSDINGVARPVSGAWDLGAYNFSNSSGDLTAPVAPVGLIVQ